MSPLEPKHTLTGREIELFLDGHEAGTRAIGALAELFDDLPDDDLVEPTGYPPLALERSRAA